MIPSFSWHFRQIDRNANSQNIEEHFHDSPHEMQECAWASLSVGKASNNSFARIKSTVECSLRTVDFSISRLPLARAAERLGNICFWTGISLTFYRTPVSDYQFHFSTHSGQFKQSGAILTSETFLSFSQNPGTNTLPS
jgi:hypothetical protein